MIQVKQKQNFKGLYSVCVISSKKPSCKDGNVRFIKVTAIESVCSSKN